MGQGIEEREAKQAVCEWNACGQMPRLLLKQPAKFQPGGFARRICA
jgi:hypothetical protein